MNTKQPKKPRTKPGAAPLSTRKNLASKTGAEQSLEKTGETRSDRIARIKKIAQQLAETEKKPTHAADVMDAIREVSEKLIRSRFGGVDEFAERHPVAAKIKALRAKLGYTQTQLAEAVGVTQPTVQRWEAGTNYPDKGAIVALARLANTTPPDFEWGTWPGVIDLPTIPTFGYAGQEDEVTGYSTETNDPSSGEPVLIDHLPFSGERPLAIVKVRGDWLLPFKDGWTLFCDRDPQGVPEACINQLCLVQLADSGRKFIKEVRRGSAPGLYTLISWRTSPIENVKLDWALLIVDIRPKVP